MNLECLLRRVMLPAIVVPSVSLGAAPSWAAGVQAQPAATSQLSLMDSLIHDAGSAMTLIERQLAVPFRFSAGLPVLLSMLALAVAIAWPFRLWLLARLDALLIRSHHKSALSIYATAVTTVVVTTIVVAFAGWLALTALNVTLPLLPEIGHLAQTTAMGIGIAGLGLGIGRALRSPQDKSRRPIQMPPGLGRVIGFYPFSAGIMLGVSAFIDQTSRILHATATSWMVAQSVVVMAQVLLIGRFLLLAGKARERQVEAASSAGEDAGIPAVFSVTAIAWFALMVGCGAFVFGQTRFGGLLIQELLWAGLLLTLAWLLTRFLDAGVIRLLDTDRRAGRFATGIIGVQQARVAQAAMLGSIFLTVIVWVFVLGLIAAPFSGGGSNVAEQMRPVPLLNALRQMNISPRTILIAMAVLFGGIALTRIFRRWLENRFLPSTSLDIGARASILTTLSYVGIIIAMLSATNVLGVQLEKITLIASALSVGIGFGLQSIIQNFVSGLILLIERPVTLGDWVSVSGAEGTIRKIRVRATEIATADGSISIVPNSAFITTNVANRMDKRMAERIDLALTVAGCASADEAKAALLDMITHCDVVHHDPAPRIFLRALGDNAWTFDLRIYGHHDHTPQDLKSELLLWLSRESPTRNLKLTMA